MRSIQDIMGVLSGGKMPVDSPDTGKPSFIGGSAVKVSDQDLEAYIGQASSKYGIPRSYIRAIIERENSGHYANIKNPKSSATGMMQLIDSTAKSLGVQDATDPLQNIMGGTAYLKQQLDTFGGFDKAVAAYFQGPGAIQSKVDTGQGFGGLQDATGTTTEDYLSGVKQSLSKYQQEYGEEGYTPGPIGGVRKPDIRERVSNILATGGQRPAPMKTGMSVDEIADVLRGAQKPIQQPETPQGQQITAGPAEIPQPVEPIAGTTVGPKEGYLKGLGKSAVAGVANVVSGFYSIPAATVSAYLGLTNIFNKAVNLGAKAVTGKPVLKENYQVPDWLIDNSLVQYPKKVAQEQGVQGRESDLKGKNLLTLIGEKKFADAGKYLSYWVAEQAPTTVGVGGMIATGVPKLLTLSTMGALSAGQKAVELHPKAKSGEISQTEASINTVLNGVAEAGFEAGGEYKVLEALANSFKGIAKDIGEQQAKQTFFTVFKDIAKGFYQGAKVEVPNEMATQYAQDLTDKITGVNPELSWEQIVANQVDVLGGTILLGGGPGAMTSTMNQINKAKGIKDAGNIQRDQGKLSQEVIIGETKPAEVKPKALEVDEDLQKQQQGQIERLKKDTEVKLKAFNDDKTPDEIIHENNNSHIDFYKQRGMIYDESTGQFVKADPADVEKYWSTFGRIGLTDISTHEGTEPSPFQVSRTSPRGTPPGTPPVEEVVKETKAVAGTENVVNYGGTEVTVDEQGRFYPADQKEITERVSKVVMEAGGKIPPKGVIYPGQTNPEDGSILQEPSIMYNLKDGSTKLLPLKASDKEIREAIEKSNAPVIPPQPKEPTNGQEEKGKEKTETLLKTEEPSKVAAQLPKYKKSKITSGVYKGGVLLEVIEGPHKGVIGIAPIFTDIEGAENNLRRSIKEREVMSAEKQKEEVKPPEVTFKKAKLIPTRSGIVVEPVEEKTRTPNERLIYDLTERLQQGKSFKNTRELLDVADEIHGGTVAEGKYGIRDAYDALESAMNRHIEAEGVSGDPKAVITRLNELISRLPTQTVRTKEQTELQQFSTPPSEAYLSAKLTGIKKGMKAIEPSAGDANIAIMMRALGGDVHVNEISESRRANLKALGFEPTGVDAEYLNSTLPEEIQADVISMNPPFSSTGGRLTHHDTGFGAEHVRQALLRVKPGGRLVAIVGKGMAFGKPKMASWWNTIMKKYNVRANVGISGKEYTKYGTGFDNNIIVIDNTGPTKTVSGLPVGAITGQNLTVEQAYDKMKSLIEEDVHGRIKEADKAGTGETPKGVSTGGKKVSSVGTGVSTPGGRGRGTETGKRGEPGPAGVDEVRGDQVEKPEGTGIPVSTDVGEGKPEGGEPGRPRGGEPRDVGPGQPGSVTAGVQHVQLNKGEGGAVEEESGGVYAKYKVRKAKYAGSKSHPAKISESVVMASVESPDVTYKLHLPEAMIKTGIPSDVQLEAITYACQAHEQKNIDGSRKEFLLGDGTGTGKMITILGIISENFRQGRKKAVIISKKRDLVNQMKGDMDKMGLKYPVIEQGKYKATEEIGENEGILFTTYGTASGDWSKTKPRYNQIINWLGKDFDGVVVFDESHSMKNVSESQFQGEEGDIKNLQEGTNSGQMGVAFKKELKDARFVNASATAATTPTNLGYLTRMGLWGEGTPFKDFIAFLNVMRDGGIGAMELLARDMKASGQYLSRSISYDGISYSTVKHELSEGETATYDEMADFWSEMLASMEEAAKNAGMRKAGQNIMKQFYATQQRFFLQLMTSFKTESMLKYADEEIAKGNSPVISLYSTGEAATTRAVDEARANGDDLDIIELSPKQMMADMVEKQYPIYQYEDYEENGQKGTRQVLDAAGNPLINKENYEARQAMIERIKNLHMPDNPLDKIVNHFGEGKIAEITGRKRRMMVDVTGRKTYKERAIKGISQNKINEHERNAFQSGQKIAAVISGAGSIGLDFHAAKNVKNQRRRVFISLQLSWSADQSQQAEGRVHRSNQVSAPHIALTATNIASEQRLVNANQKRLASMGGITKGGRETLTHGSMKAEDITDEYGKAALAWLYKQLPRSTLKRMNLLNKEGTLKPNAEGNVDGFLNRIMVLRVADQNEIFDRFYKRYEDIVEAAKAAGTYDVGVEKLRGENIRVAGEPLVVHTDKSSGVETRLITLEAMRPVNREEFDDRMEKLGIEGFPAIQKNSKKYYLAKIRDNGDVDVYGPKGHHEKFDTKWEFKEKYEEGDNDVLDEAKKGWNEELKKVPEKEAHKTTIATGSIFPVYDKLFFGEERRRVVKRAVLENGESYIGIEIPSKNIPKIKQNFGIGSKLYEATPQELLDLIHGGSIIELDNSWKITERKVQGQKRIEIETERAPSEAEMDRAGVFSETIQWTNRYFIPTEEEKALESIGKLIELHRPVRDLSAGQIEAAAAFEKKPPKYTEADYSAPVAPDAESVKHVDMVRDIQGDKTLTQKLDFMQASQKTGDHISWNPKGKKNNLEFLNRAEKFYSDWKELAFPIQKVQDIAQKEGIPIADAENIDYAIDQVRGSPARAKQWIDDKLKPIFDAIPSKINGKKVSRGAVYAEAVKYMVARRSKDLYENEEKGYVDGGYDKATADKMVDFVEIGSHPWAKEIQRVADGLWKVTKELRQMKLDAGIIDDELFDALTEEHYVPFCRDIKKPGKVSKTGGGDRFTATSKGIMRIKGSLKGSPIIDPVQGVIQQVYETIQNVARAKVANTLVDLAERSETVGELVKELPPKWIKAGTIEHRGAVDMILRPQIEALAEELGIKVEYTAKLAGHVGGRMTKLLGLFTEDRIKALVGATEGTVAHELGHGIHNSGKYQWIEGIADRNVNEMNLIADSRYQGEEVPVKYVTYVRSTKEKIAEFISMYLTDRAMLQEMAPNSVRELEAKIADDPILKKMIEMKPSNVAGIHSIEVANFVRDRSIPRDEDVISVLRGGNIKSYRVPLEVAVAIKNLNPSMFPGWFRVLMLPTQIVRAGAVGLNIDFMIPNVFRDQMDAAINAKTIPGVDWMLGFKSFISHDEIYRQYNLMGGGMESAEAGIGGGKAKASELQYGGKSFMDPYYWQTYGVFHGLTQASWYTIKSPFRALYGIAEISEMSSRLGTFRRGLKGIKGVSKPLSPEAAIHAARQATLDFQRFGRYGKGANEIIPFINAGFEGIDKMARTFKDDPKRAILKAMVYAVLPMIGLYLLNRKDERYKAVPLRDKILNWIIMKEDGGYWKIPKGHITKWVVNPVQIPLEIAMGDIIDDNKPMVVYKVARDLSPVDYNSLIPPTIKLIVEPIANYDLYWNEAIEKPSIKAIPIPGMRWDTRTSGALKYIGKALNISPIMMQHELETLGAGFAKNILWVSDMASGRYTKEEIKIQGVPVARRFVGQLNEWNTDIDRNIREINKQLSEMNEISMRKMIKSYGHTPADIQELRKRNSEFRYKLERKRYELTKAKDEIKYFLSKGK